MNLTPVVLGDGRVQVIVEETLNGSVFRDALYYASVAAHNAAVTAGADVSEAQRRVDTWVATTLTARVLMVRILRPAPLDAVSTPEGCVAWGGYWDYIVAGDVSAIPSDAVYAASFDSAGVYRTVIVAPAVLLFQYNPDGWNPKTWPSFN